MSKDSDRASKNEKIKTALYLLRRKRRNMNIVFGVIFATTVAGIFLKIQTEVIAAIVALGILVLMGLRFRLAVFTCPRCHSNYFGALMRVERNECANCGLKINGADINNEHET